MRNDRDQRRADEKQQADQRFQEKRVFEERDNKWAKERGLTPPERADNITPAGEQGEDPALRH